MLIMRGHSLVVVATSVQIGIKRLANNAGNSLLEAARKLRSLQEVRPMHFSRNEIFRATAWRILLEIYIYLSEQQSTYLLYSDLGADLGGNSTVRWLRVLAEAGYISLDYDVQNSSRSVIMLTDKGFISLSTYLEAAVNILS